MAGKPKTNITIKGAIKDARGNRNTKKRIGDAVGRATGQIPQSRRKPKKR